MPQKLLKWFSMLYALVLFYQSKDGWIQAIRIAVMLLIMIGGCWGFRIAQAASFNSLLISSCFCSALPPPSNPQLLALELGADLVLRIHYGGALHNTVQDYTRVHHTVLSQTLGSVLADFSRKQPPCILFHGIFAVGRINSETFWCILWVLGVILAKKRDHACARFGRSQSFRWMQPFRFPTGFISRFFCWADCI